MTEEGTEPSLCGNFSQLAWFILDEFHVLTFVSSKIHNKQTGAIFKLQRKVLLTGGSEKMMDYSLFS